MGKIPSDKILFPQVEIMCSSIKYVLKVIIFSIFILVTGIEKGETLRLKAAPWALESDFVSWRTQLRVLTNEGVPSVSLWSLGPWSWLPAPPATLAVVPCCGTHWAPDLELWGVRGRFGHCSERLTSSVGCHGDVGRQIGLN